MSTQAPPPRLHVLLARGAPSAVVIRRGPAKVACTIGWDRRDDTFTIGQWLKGRIYERRCDLSPDGAHFIYFALTGKWSAETMGAYTALSRAPYIKALGLWPEGSTWGGGGLFADSQSYWVAGDALRLPPGLRQVKRCPWPNPGCRWHPVYCARLVRDGWRWVADPPAEDGEPRGLGLAGAFERPAGRGWTLHMRLGYQARGGGPLEYERYRLVQAASGRSVAQPEWEWADVDGGRLVWADGGRLCAATLGEDGLGAAAVLHDFNGMRFEPIAAPY